MGPCSDGRPDDDAVDARRRLRALRRHHKEIEILVEQNLGWWPAESIKAYAVLVSQFRDRGDKHGRQQGPSS